MCIAFLTCHAPHSSDTHNTVLAFRSPRWWKRGRLLGRSCPPSAKRLLTLEPWLSRCIAPTTSTMKMRQRWMQKMLWKVNLINNCRVILTNVVWSSYCACVRCNSQIHMYTQTNSTPCTRVPRVEIGGIVKWWLLQVWKICRLFFGCH